MYDNFDKLIMINDIILIMNVALKEVNFWTKGKQHHYWPDVIDITTRRFTHAHCNIRYFHNKDSLT